MAFNGVIVMYVTYFDKLIISGYLKLESSSCDVLCSQSCQVQLSQSLWAGFTQPKLPSATISVFEGWIWVLIAPFSGHCILVTFFRRFDYHF